MLKLADDLKSLNGLGEKTTQKLNLIGIYTIEHLLFHLPYRYQDKTSIISLKKAQINTEVLVELKINYIEEIYTRQRQLICYLTDNTQQTMILRFFYFTKYQKQLFIRGATVQCFGELKIGKNGLEMFHPEYRIISKNQQPLLQKTLSPIYSLTADISQAKLKKYITVALNILEQTPINDSLAKITTEHMPTFKKAIKLLHNPTKDIDMNKIANFKHIAQQRLIIDELCAHQLSLLKLKKQHKNKIANVFTIKNNLTNKLLTKLKFTLTTAQKRSINEINADLASNNPMLRLLQGDVGSGKTIVAIFTCLQAVENNFQTAIMAPTEILADQHLQSFSNYFNNFNINITFLIGNQNNKEKKEQLLKIKNGTAQIIIGTHALFQKTVIFNKLGLIIIDEQHKFGVHQRLSLTQKANNIPHQLVMTATPIPRSLTISAYADLDISIIDELPKNRTCVHTIAINNTRKDEIIKKIKQVCAAKKQVYWVCTLIEESEKLRAQSAKNTYNYLQQNLTGLTVSLIHGKIHKDTKKQIMSDFMKNAINVLVATTVIEVGIDTSNATLIVIENAERLGLAQLHQLRGRVGRGSHHSMCVLMHKGELSQQAKKRINILRHNNNGFIIAQKDLELRGPGDILGTQQTGIANMKIANIVRDTYLMKQVQSFSKYMLAQDKEAQQTLIKRWINDKKNQHIGI